MKNSILIFCLALLAALFVNQTAWASPADTLWTETWERTNWTNDWHVDAGTWDAGVPTSGPGKPYRGQKCAATVLGGNYPDNANTRLIRINSFTVPPASAYPRLRFWHWFDIEFRDAGYVQIKTVGGDWKTISPAYTNTGGNIWSHASIDLSSFANSTVQIAFLFTSNCCDARPGWYLDDITVVTGAPTSPVINLLEKWELGLGDWFAERGTWEVGTPSLGPNSSYSPPNCAATILKGHYPDNAETRLISPPFKIPSANLSPRLRFYHWYDIEFRDAGFVQIKVGQGAWKNLLGPYTNTSGGIWTRPFADLSVYADSTVQLAFLFNSNCCDGRPGWYIDDVIIETITSVDEHSFAHDAIASFALHQNHPNPFNPSTTILYDLPHASEVEIAVFDLLGKSVRTLVQERQQAGQHRLLWDGRDDGGANVPSGVYLYRLQAGEFTQTRKMILMH